MNRLRATANHDTAAMHGSGVSRRAVVALATIAIVAFGLATCCIGFIFLAIPYVGTILLLPFLVTYRYLSLEFLAQLDPTLDVFAATQTKAL